MNRILIIDDEELARQRMRLLLEELDMQETVIDEVSNGEKALEQIDQQRPDLLLLDIKMPVMDGFDVIEMLPKPRPPVIFVTAFDEYALKAFDVHAVDYLMKPVRLERLKKSLERLKDPSYLANQQQSITELLREYQKPSRLLPHKLPVSFKQDILMLDLDKILYIEAEGKLTWVYTYGRRYHTTFRLHKLEERLEPFGFFRIHRSYIVNLKQIEKLEPWFKNGLRLKLSDGSHLDVARRRLTDLKIRLGIG